MYVTPIIVVENNKIVGYNKLASKKVKKIGHYTIKHRKQPIYALINNNQHTN